MLPLTRDFSHECAWFPQSNQYLLNSTHPEISYTQHIQYTHLSHAAHNHHTPHHKTYHIQTLFSLLILYFLQ